MWFNAMQMNWCFIKKLDILICTFTWEPRWIWNILSHWCRIDSLWYTVSSSLLNKTTHSVHLCVRFQWYGHASLTIERSTFSQWNLKDSNIRDEWLFVTLVLLTILNVFKYFWRLYFGRNISFYVIMITPTPKVAWIKRHDDRKDHLVAEKYRL